MPGSFDTGDDTGCAALDRTTQEESNMDESKPLHSCSVYSSTDMSAETLLALQQGQSITSIVYM